MSDFEKQSAAPLVVEPPVHRGPSMLATILGPLASLKLTVVLFAMAIFIVLAGTLAQVHADVWQVVEEYFRIRPSQLRGSAIEFVKAFFVWIDPKIFFPEAFVPRDWAPQFPSWVGFWFPKGWVIGGAMLLNLLSAHLIRFKLQARGMRLVAGLWLLGIGAIVTWLVVSSGDNLNGLQNTTLISYERLGSLLLVSLTLLAAGCSWLGLQAPAENKSERWLLFGSSSLCLLVLGAAIAWGDLLWTNKPSMRILYQLVKGLVAGGVLLAACQALFRKRAGIVLLHGGVALLMISEVLVGLRAVESRMTLLEGQTGSSTVDIRKPELAVIDASDPKKDIVTVVPLHLLDSKGEQVSDALLPFDVETVKFYKNAVIPPALPPGPDNPATAGAGLRIEAQSVDAATGVDNAGGVDRPALYVRLTGKNGGADLGTWLTSDTLTPQEVKVGDKTYKIELQFARTYLPYSLTLLDAREDRYIGTSKARNYSSTVLLDDPDSGSKQELRIWMNNPLRYRGLTFYQSGLDHDQESGKDLTTLQVVSNTGWMIPYVSCMIVGVGMCYQFVLTLLRSLNRWSRIEPLTAVGTATTPTGRSRVGSNDDATVKTGWSRWLPLAICVVFAAYVGSKARSPRVRTGEMDLAAFGKLPLAYEGRVKPFDTLARNSLLMLSGKQEYYDKDNHKQPAIRWLLDVISSSPNARGDRVFRITNLEVLKLLQLEPRSGFTYTLAEIAPQLDAFDREMNALREAHQSKKDQLNLTVYQRSLKELGQNLTYYQRLLLAFDPPGLDLPTEAERKADEKAADQKMMAAIQTAMEDTRRIREAEVVLSIPVPNTNDESDNVQAATATTGYWLPYSSEVLRGYLQRIVMQGTPPVPVTLMQQALSNYREGNASGFNDAVNEYTGWLNQHPLPQVSLSKVRYESFFNQFSPFYWSMILCLFAFILSAIGWLGFSEPLRRSAFWLMVLTFAIHTFALISRIYISGRPPVTNLYTTGVFIGWAVVLFGLICERMYPLGVGNAVASLAGFITLGISHFLSEGGDTFTVLEAVLDTQFWLATHVVTINLGYAATAAAGLFGVYHSVYRLLSTRPLPAVEKAVTRMTYGSLCFAILFSFVGTVLGGLWADDSWGRFWGWDPKENGALIIVLWNCLVLHAKWDGMIKDRGLAVLSTLGLIAVSWSWFGTNQLGAGLHAYGFTDAARIGLFVTWGLAIALAGIGCLPRRQNDAAS